MLNLRLIWRKPELTTKGISSPQMSSIQPSEAPPPPLRSIPPLTALLAFERAASQLSFRRAARDLSLSPSAISHQIRGLEEQFGTKLFVRGARSVRLTADGERYFAKVSAALAALQDASRDGPGLSQIGPALTSANDEERAHCRHEHREERSGGDESGGLHWLTTSARSDRRH